MRKVKFLLIAVFSSPRPHRIVHITTHAPFRPGRFLYNAREMTNRIAFYIGVAILVILAVDYALGLGLALFLARRFLDLINLIAVWR